MIEGILLGFYLTIYAQRKLSRAGVRIRQNRMKMIYRTLTIDGDVVTI